MSQKIVTIPIHSTAGEFTLQTRLGLEDFRLRFIWNARVERWVLDIYLPDGTALLCGVILQANVNVLEDHKNPLLPSGELYAWDQNDDPVAPGRDDLGNRVKMIFVTEE